MPESLEEYKRNVANHGLELYHRFYGPKRAKVTRNDDPEKRGRIQIEAPVIHAKGKGPSVWVDPGTGGGPDCGIFWPPEVGSTVWVFFEDGDPSWPMMYIGGWFTMPEGISAVPSEFEASTGDLPNKRGFVTRAGHTVVFNDEPDKEVVMITWHQPSSSDPSKTDRTQTADRTAGKTASLSFDKSGVMIRNGEKPASYISLNAEKNQVVVADQNGNLMTMDKDGVKMYDSKGNYISLNKGDIDLSTKTGNASISCNALNLRAGGISLGGELATEPAVLGLKLLTWLSTHTHPVSGAVAGPPVGAPPACLSTATKVK